MDWGQTTFQGMYKAATLLVGVAANKAAGTPGLFSMLLGKASAPAAAGVTASLAVPGAYLNMHSAHALVLFNALRAESKYGDKREHLRAVVDAMKEFEKAIRGAVQSSSPVPTGLPSTSVGAFFTGHGGGSFANQVEAAVAHVRAFTAMQDLILNDAERCIGEWNNSIGSIQHFLAKDKPRNIFENLQHQVVNKDIDWVKFGNSSFSNSVNLLFGHRNKWAKILDLPPRHRVAMLRI